jgi:O-antigen ligase
MVGTFFWWNPYAAYLLAPALLGLTLAVVGRRPWRSVAWLATPFTVAGIVLSTSRATLACLAAGWLIVGVVVVITQPRRSAALVRAATLTVLSVAVTYVLTSPLLFQVNVSALGGAQARAGGGGTVAANSAHRIEFWHQAFRAFVSSPLDGTGYGRILSAGTPSTATASSPLAHNGFLQALAEGGVLLAVPLALALAGSAVLLVLALRRPTNWGGVPFAAGIAGLGLIVHGLVDFDWTFPANVGALALCVALAAAPRWQAEHSTKPRRLVGGLLVALALTAGVLAVGQSFEIVHIDASTPGATS